MPEHKHIPEIRLHHEETMTLFSLFAAVSELKNATENERFMNRIKVVPGARRDFAMITNRLAKVTEDILMTIPAEKLIGVRRQISRMRYQMIQGPIASKTHADDEEIITTRELDELVYSAWEAKCRMCIDGNCDRCDLGRVLDGVVARDRNHGSWSDIDIRCR